MSPTFLNGRGSHTTHGQQRLCSTEAVSSKQNSQQCCKKECGITKKVITTRNPQANSMAERVHQVTHQLMCTMGIKGKTDLYAVDFGWAGMLSDVRQAVRSTAHTTQQATPAQLVFGHDVILNVIFKADWQNIKEHKLHRIIQNDKKKCYMHSSPICCRQPHYGKTGPITKTRLRPLLGATHGRSNQ
jgi:hypothetical protein